MIFGRMEREICVWVWERQMGDGEWEVGIWCNGNEGSCTDGGWGMGLEFCGCV